MSDAKLAVHYQDILDAAETLRGVTHRTPVMTSTQMNEQTGAEVFFKCENFQRGGAFKFRGAYNAISRLTASQKESGIISFSSGNHAQAIALAGRILDVRTTIVMPMDAPAAKLAATRGYGAQIVLYDRHTENREVIANYLAQERGLTIIPPFDHPHIIAGQGTAALELFEEVGQLDYLFVPVGGGGLISGSALSASHLSPTCHVIGVEPEVGNDVQLSFRSGARITIPVPNTIADGAQTTCVGQLTFPIIQNLVQDIVTVSDDELKTQMRFFAERMKIVVEPTGCLAAAAVAGGRVDVRRMRVGVILSGGNMNFG